MGDLSILMPVYNERETIEAAIADALEADLPVASRQLVVVDDGSTDGTRECCVPDWPRTCASSLTTATGARELPCRRRSPKQKRRSLPSSTPISSIGAADLADVITPLLEGRANVVFGTRAWTSRRRATSGT